MNIVIYGSRPDIKRLRHECKCRGVRAVRCASGVGAPRIMGCLSKRTNLVCVRITADDTATIDAIISLWRRKICL